MSKVLNRIFAMPLMVLALLVFFVSIGWATFIENDYGTPVAQKLVFKAKWFEFVILYLSLSMLHNIYRFKLLRKEKAGAFVFHVAFLVIVVGAAFTRYFGFEGVMTIREGSMSNEIISSETYFKLKIHDSIVEHNYEEALIMEEGTNNYFDYACLFPGAEEESTIEFVSLLDNVKDTIYRVGKNEGEPYLEIVTVGSDGRAYNYVKSGTLLNDGGYIISFNNDEFPEAIQAISTDSGLYVIPPFDIPYLQMADSTQGVIVKDSLQRFIAKRLYIVGGQQFVLNAYYESGKVDVVKRPGKPEKGDAILKAVTVKVTQGELSQQVLLTGGKGMPAETVKFRMGELNYELAFGSKVVYLPFSIQLRDFQMERFPGTNTPSSYASEVTIVDPETDFTEDHRIFMNTVLDYRGYRFFQSSYAPDEGGTVLSVNQDRLGTYTSYAGYSLLALGFIISLLSSGSRFRFLLNKAREVRMKRESLGSLVVLIGLMFSQASFCQEKEYGWRVDYEHAEKYGRLIVQDQVNRGRFKPVHTLATEALRKISRQNSYNGLSPMQVFLGIHTDANWLLEPLVYVSGDSLQRRFQCDSTGGYASFSDFYTMDTAFYYFLTEDYEEANRKKPSEQTQYDKDVLKTTERVSILSGLFGGTYLMIIPLEGDSTNTWFTPFDVAAPFTGEHQKFFLSIVPDYNYAVRLGVTTGNWKLADMMVKAIGQFQREVAPAELLPSETKVEWEIFYNKADIFRQMKNAYLFLGLLVLIIQFLVLFYPRWKVRAIMRIFYGVFIILVLFVGFGLGLRWYLSGHAPWSDGYEAVVFIAFVTSVAGLLFSRKNSVVLGATAILAWLMLFVAHMSALDPEMTPLVPVLNSYWLKIHVAIITGSYAFLGLGAIVGLLIIIMKLFISPQNRSRILLTTKELTYISEMTMTIGLFMLTIGTFLGGVWANESWGRYWGWDAKETWALASVVTYAMILHMRFIPFLKSEFAFNTASLWGYSSIIMTFFGVNFYLSGLHSYAQGDPVPVPVWVPITVAALIALNLISYLRFRSMTKFDKEEV